MRVRALKTFDSGHVGHVRQGHVFDVHDKLGHEMCGIGIVEMAPDAPDPAPPVPAPQHRVVTAGKREFNFGGAPDPAGQPVIAPPAKTLEDAAPKPRRRTE